MALPLAPVGHQQFFDANGDPLASGTLETYAAGTSTPKATTSDADGLVDNPTTITLNASGRPSVSGNEVSLFLKAGGYKFVLKNSSGTTIWTADNIVGVSTGPTVLSKTSAYVVTTTDGDDVLILVDATAGAVTITLYAVAGNAGKRVTVMKVDSSANTVTIDGNGSETINGATTLTLANQYELAALETNGSAWYARVSWQDLKLKNPELKSYREVSSSPSIVAGALTLDLANGNHFSVALGANITSITFSNVPATGKPTALVLRFVADGSVRTITWPASVKWAGGVAPTMTGTNAKVDIITLYTVDGGTTWYAFIGGQSF